MALPYEDIKCPLIEASVRNGYIFMICEFSGSLLSRIQLSDKNVIASNVADSVCLLVQKDEWQLQPDKLRYRTPFKRTLGNGALDTFIKRGGKVLIKSYKSGFEGTLVSINGQPLNTRNVKSIPALLACLEIDALQYI